MKTPKEIIKEATTDYLRNIELELTNAILKSGKCDDLISDRNAIRKSIALVMNS